MKSSAKETLRWLAVLGCGGYVLYNLGSSLHFMFTRPATNGTFLHFFPLLALLLLHVPLLLIAYFCLRQQYRGALRVLAAVATLILWGVLMGLPNRLGFFRWIVPEMSERPWLLLLGLPLSLLFLFGPFYAAGWFYRLCERWIEPFRPTLAASSRTPNPALERTPTAANAGSVGDAHTPQ